MKTPFVMLQHVVPQHLLSRVAGQVAGCETSSVKNAAIRAFIRQYKVDMSEAEQPDPSAYPNFNSFFTRALRPGARPICTGDAVACPADGRISQVGGIEGGRIFQAKGQSFSVDELLGGVGNLAGQFDRGSFITVYLSPSDYHRVHMPCDGKLLKTIYVPGDLFSVNQTTAAEVPRLFARNERLVSLFETPHGPMASVLVGAMIVAGIETVWGGRYTTHAREIQMVDFDRGSPVALSKGDEMGRFLLGSTVILLFPEGRVTWDGALGADVTVRMGQRLGDY